MRGQRVRRGIVPAIVVNPLFHGLLHVRGGPANAGFGMQCKFGLRVLADRTRQATQWAQRTFVFRQRAHPITLRLIPFDLIALTRTPAHKTLIRDAELAADLKILD